LPADKVGCTKKPEHLCDGAATVLTASSSEMNEAKEFPRTTATTEEKLGERDAHAAVEERPAGQSETDQHDDDQ